MSSKWIYCLGVAIGIVCCECEPHGLRADDPGNNQEKWLFLLDQIRSHSEQLKAGECTITGRMYSPKFSEKTITIDHKFEILLAFERPLKYRYEWRAPAWINDQAQAGVDEKGNPTAGFKFDYSRFIFATNGPDGAWWAEDHGDWINVLPRSKAEPLLDRIGKDLYFPDIAYLTLYSAYARNNRQRPDEIINVLKKQQNVSIDDSGPLWKAHWITPTKVKEKKLDVVVVIEVDTANGFTVTRYAVLMRWPDSEELVQEQLTAKWQLQNGVFVPIHYTTQIGVVKKGTSYTTTEADFNWSSVNTPLPESLFEWGSFDVPPGTGVLDTRTQKPYFIKEMARAIPPSPAPEPNRRWKWWVIGSVAVAFAVLVIYLYRRHVRRTTLT